MNRNNLIASLQQIKTLAAHALKEIAGGAAETRNERTSIATQSGRVKKTQLSFETNVLAFMNEHARGLKGQQKFTLLLARMTKGSTTAVKSSAEIEKQWNKMTSVLGGRFNRAYATRAKAEGWVDSPKHGVYTLAAHWREAWDGRSEP